MATNFTDHNGTVIQFVRAYLIFWGNAWASNPLPTPSSSQVSDAVDRILSGGYLTGLSQYRGIGQGYILGSSTVTSSNPPNGFTDSNVATFIKGLIQAGTIPDLDPDNQTLYLVLMPKGIKAANSGFVGEHTYYTDSKNRRVHFGWITNNGTLPSVSIITSHEIPDVMTDPEGTAILGDAGTCSGTGWCEIGDVCQSTTGTVNGASVQSYWSQSNKTCTVFDYPAQTFPFVGTQFTGTVRELVATLVHFQLAGMAASRLDCDAYGLPSPIPPMCLSTSRGDTKYLAGGNRRRSMQTGIQFRGTVPANQTQRWFTFNWNPFLHVIWTVVPVSINTGAP